MCTDDNISQKETVDLLNKCWMTHDGLWFFHCLKEFGIEKTNKINKAAIKSLSEIEIKRIKNALGKRGNIETFDGFRIFFQKASKLVIPEFMNVTFSFPKENKMFWTFEQGKCFAYAGIKKLGVLDSYECGVLYRVQCWLETLGIEHRFDPGVDKCHMHHGNGCSGVIELNFKGV
ncbi:MAG: hypothetical protein HY881_03620 [Deltaproteobacteria bacterium]|nr:hypothetical protein [Deltaproteobacteria bacterium]